MDGTPAERPHSGDPHEGHVHFAPEQVKSHDLEIQIKYSESCVDVHLGFLQVFHHYEVKFIIKDTLTEDIHWDPEKNLNTQIKSYMPTEDGEGHELLIQFNAHKEKLVQEKLTIYSLPDKDKCLDIVLHARVLGKGKGTPALKNGIHCYKVDVEEDSEASDWQGFD